jgi:hypothetical protein
MKPLLAASKVLMRLHQWRAAAILLAYLPYTSLDATSRGRLSYALLMLHRTHPALARQLLDRVLTKNGELTPQELLELATMAIRAGNGPLARQLMMRSASKGHEGSFDAAHRLHMLHSAHIDGRLPFNLKAMLDDADIPVEGLLTLVPISSRYTDLWSLWIEQVRHHIGGAVVAIALDDAVLPLLQSEPGVAVVDARDLFAWSAPGTLHDVSRGVLWQIRTLLLQQLVSRNRSVLVLDLDAVPLGNVPALLAAAPHADVIAQEDHSLPMDVERQLGFILCCGFMFWRPTPAAHELLRRFADEVMVERDDQLALNHILGREGITAQTRTGGWMTFTSAGAQFACPSPALVSRTLHSGTVVRHFQQEGHTVPQLRAAMGL